MMLLPEIKNRSILFDIVYQVVLDIHTSPQNPMYGWKSFNCSSYAILWNLLHSSKYSVTNEQYIQIALEVEQLKKQASVLLQKQYPLHATSESSHEEPVAIPEVPLGQSRVRKTTKTVEDADLLTHHENKKAAIIRKNYSFALKKRKPKK